MSQFAVAHVEWNCFQIRQCGAIITLSDELHSLRNSIDLSLVSVCDRASFMFIFSSMEKWLGFSNYLHFHSVCKLNFGECL